MIASHQELQADGRVEEIIQYEAGREESERDAMDGAIEAVRRIVRVFTQSIRQNPMSICITALNEQPASDDDS